MPENKKIASNSIHFVGAEKKQNNNRTFCWSAWMLRLYIQNCFWNCSFLPFSSVVLYINSNDDDCHYTALLLMFSGKTAKKTTKLIYVYKNNCFARWKLSKNFVSLRGSWLLKGLELRTCTLHTIFLFCAWCNSLVIFVSILKQIKLFFLCTSFKRKKFFFSLVFDVKLVLLYSY